MGAHPVDRAKRGSKLHLAVEGGGLPLSVLVTGANTNDALVFEALLDDLPTVRRPAGGRAHRWEVVQQRLQYQAVVEVGPGHQHRQRQPAALNRQVQLGAALGPVDRVCATWSPLVARRLKESTLTRDQSSPPAAPSSSSSTSWSRSNTPAWAHSAKRRQQVVTLPQPNSPTDSSAQGVEVRAMKMIAAMQGRSGTVRGTPPRAREGGGGSSGWMRCHSPLGSSLSASVVMSRDHPITRTQPGPLPDPRFRNVL